jgi:uncharacterized protein (TIGR02996 family)
MTEESDFIAAILSAPRDDALRLVFADWLEERSDLRGEFLRVVVRLEALSEQYEPEDRRAKLRRVREIAGLKRRLRELREVIPPDWAMRISRGWIEHCNLRGPGADLCPRRWELLEETDCPAVRRCRHCSRDVWCCWSVPEVGHALRSDHPVVLALAMDRVENAALD